MGTGKEPYMDRRTYVREHDSLTVLLLAACRFPQAELSVIEAWYP